ncbi:MAG: helix-turn-helix domain-containing protein [Acidobacteriaceae bacterium]
MSYGKYIRQLRETRGISLNAFAPSLGISAAYWSRIEREQEKPPKDTLIEAAAHALESSVDESFIQAGRLPPDMHAHLRDIVKTWRRKEARRGG